MNILGLLKKAETFVFDVDGVLSDGKVFLAPDAQNGYAMSRNMHTKDGYALQLAQRKGYKLIIISGGTDEGVRHRMQYLGMHHVFLGVKDKLACMQEVFKKENINAASAIYMGDDIPDYTPMQYCGIKACPQDAVREIKSISQYISPFKGGHGCARDLIEKVLKLRYHWEPESCITV